MRPVTRRIAGFGPAGAALALLAACEIERLPNTAASGESAAAVVATADTTRPATDVTTGVGTPPAAAATVDSSGGAIADSDDASPVASPDELSALARGLVVPVAGVGVDALTDTFEEARGERRHEAIDILAPRGTPVLSAADGRLLALHDSRPGGLMVYAADASGRFVLLYGHLDRYAPGLVEGMALRRGQELGTVGTTGNAPPGTPHLHFGIARVANTRDWWRGTPVNPMPLLAGTSAR
jgi:murein DD-endopeptidase MepM/ murein hydrolase activator NlpD